jgi:hypothetical protein
MRFLIMSFWKSSECYAVTMPFVQSSGSYAFIVAFVRLLHRRSSPRQDVLGLSLSRRNEGLGLAAGSRGRQQIVVGGGRWSWEEQVVVGGSR